MLANYQSVGKSSGKMCRILPESLQNFVRPGFLKETLQCASISACRSASEAPSARVTREMPTGVMTRTIMVAVRGVSRLRGSHFIAFHRPGLQIKFPIIDIVTCKISRPRCDLLSTIMTSVLKYVFGEEVGQNHVSIEKIVCNIQWMENLRY